MNMIPHERPNDDELRKHSRFEPPARSFEPEPETERTRTDDEE